jgi:hypothetical protein
MPASSPRLPIVALVITFVVGFILTFLPLHGEYKWDPDNPDRAGIENRMLELGKDYDVADNYGYGRYANATDRALMLASSILLAGSLVGGVVYAIWVHHKSERSTS